MGVDDRMENTAEDLKGKAKEATGKVTDNERLEAEGKIDQAKADMKNTVEDVKDAFVPARACPGAARRGIRIPASAEQTLQALDALEQRAVAERVAQAQVAAGAERLAGHGGDVGLLEHEVGELE